ncbi:leucine-rich repeat domain-containing protein [Mesomycoplasma hyorhinis]|uniref:leucine-rich repeat domain-containing protein n=1 Tax=Mesomycoplasma hyorhinis TaxID=2100 RepID=UPI001C055AB6|nr:leucine-rich repeat domain-containing protein [Mesomycoplasma hyorhinis]
MNKKIIFKQDAKEILNNSSFYYNNVLDLSSLDLVEEIADFAFSASKKTIEKVILPINLKKIGQSSFMYNQIKKIVWNDKIEHLSFACFENNKIQDLVIPNSLKSIEESSFAMNLIKKLEIPETLTHLETDTFFANAIEDLEIHHFNNKILKQAFSSNENIKNIKLISDFKFFQNKAEIPFKSLVFYFLDHFSDYENEVELEINNENITIFLKSLEIENIQKIILENSKSDSDEVFDFYVEKINTEFCLEFKLISKKRWKSNLKIL